MGKYILCTGKVASKAYTFHLSKVEVYTIEELSFYLYENIYEIYDDFLDEMLIQWIRDELEMPELYEKLYRLLQQKKSIKDVVVTILCSNDYYTEEEIKKLIVIIDEIMNLNPLQRRKIKGDYYLKYGFHKKAWREYESILTDHEIAILTEEEYGNILHNIGVVLMKFGSLKEAGLQFKEAYNLNHNQESLKEYMITLMLGEDSNLLEQEMANYEISWEEVNKCIQFIGEQTEKAKKSEEYCKIELLEQLKEEALVSEYYQKISDILVKWVQDYRRQIKTE